MNVNIMKAYMAIVFAVLIFLSGCTLFGEKKPLFSGFESSATLDCETLAASDKDNCYNSKAEADLNVMLCDKIDAETIKLKCYQNLALKLKDPELCKLLASNLEKQDECYANVVAYFIEDLNKASNICAKISAEQKRIECITKVSKGSYTVEICKSFTNEITKDDCFFKLANDTNNHDYCFNLSDTEKRNRCIEVIASLKGFVDACNEISDVSLKNSCYLKSAKKLLNPEICKQITTIGERDNCYLELAPLLYNEKLCDAIVYGTTQNSCLKAVSDAQFQKAIKEGKPEICQKLQDKAERNNCYEKIGLEGKNVIGCTLINESTPIRRDSCILSLAIEQKKESYCESISYTATGIEKKDECYNKIAIAKGALTLCTKINNDSLRNSCYKDIAVNLNDYTICDNITDKTIQSECISTIANDTNNSALCFKLSERTQVDICLYNIAVKVGSGQQCAKIESVTLKSDCYNAIAKNASSYIACLGIPLAPIMNDCLQEFAEKNLDIKACDPISNANTKGSCYAVVGIKLNNLSLCDLLPQATITEMKEGIISERDYCYYKIAMEVQNNSFCLKIRDETLQADCNSSLV